MCEGAAEDYEMMLVELAAPIHAVASPPASSEQGSSTSSLISAAAKEDTHMRGAGRRIIRTCAAKDDSKNWRHFNIWQEESDGWESKGCRAVPPLACHPVRRTDEDAATEQLKSWLATCDTVHGCVPAQGARAPTRLIKVSENQVRLTQTTGELMRYTTLSHRWASDERFTLTRDTASAWMDSDIPWDTIPKTYRDAIEVTRRLGIGYIWIDTMCIQQDDAADWRRESTQMKAVYGGSYLNIAAVCAAGSHGGLFASSGLVDEFKTHEVPEPGALRIRQQPHYTHISFGSNYGGSSFLLGRGWVLQERVLAPRVVYFDQDELKWECYGGVDCLCGGMLIISNFNFDYREALGMTKGRSQHESNDSNQAPEEEKRLPMQWMRVAERYSQARLSYDSDRVIALAGIAEQALVTGRGGKYLAGHWERDLAHQLCWEVRDTHRRPAAYLAPTWSWLSVFGRLGFSNRMDYQCWASTIDARITQVECTLVDDTHETGPVKGGFLKVDGKVIEFDTRMTDPGSATTPQTFSLTHGESETTLSYGIEVDYIMTEASASQLKKLLFLYWGEMWPYRKTFLVLRDAENVEEHAGKYERLGIIWYEGEADQQEFDQLMGWAQAREGIVIV
ncbi:HET domain-containing protein [Microdochium nivale]|nr:HET domain-containing protein [Microdochium nivale]